MALGEDGGKELFDDFVLADDHFAEFASHLVAMLTEFTQQIPDALGRFSCGCV